MTITKTSPLQLLLLLYTEKIASIYTVTSKEKGDDSQVWKTV